MNNSYYFWLSYISSMAQLVDFGMNVSQISNDEIMKKLQMQDKILDEQTNDYLKKIIEQNELIIKQNEEIIKRLNK